MENVFNFNYNSKLDKLEIIKQKDKNKTFEIVKRNKIISFIFASFIILSVIDFYMIISFIKILEIM